MSFYIFKPYADKTKDPLRDLRSLCKSLFPKPHKTEPLRKITAVGAFTFGYCGYYDISRNDHRWLKNLFIFYASHAGKPISDDFTLTTMAEVEDEPKHDFLISPRPKTDFLAICNISHPLSVLRGEDSINPKLMSTHAGAPDCWAHSAREAGTQVVATAGWSDREVHDEHFLMQVNGKTFFEKPKAKKKPPSTRDLFCILYRKKEVALEVMP